MSLASGDLTTLSNAKMWLTALAGTTTSDAVIQQLITRASTQIRSWLARPTLLSQTYTTVFDGSGTRKQILPSWPVTNVTLCQVGSWLWPAMSLPPVGSGISI